MQTPMADELCKHGRRVCSDCIAVPDSAKRAYDIVRSYVTFVEYETRVRSWVALRLEDGGSDGTLYDSKRDAIRHQASEQLCAYFSYRGAPNGFGNVRDAAVWLEFHRHAYSAGMRLVDPDDAHGGQDLIMPTPAESVMDQLRRLLPGVNN
jgi:hypothetical protein